MISAKRPLPTRMVGVVGRTIAVPCRIKRLLFFIVFILISEVLAGRA